MLDFGDLSVMTKADAEAIGFVVCNDVPHKVIDLPDNDSTISAKTSDGRRVTFNLQLHEPGGTARFVESQVYHCGIPLAEPFRIKGLDAPKTEVSAEIIAFADQVDQFTGFSSFVAGTDMPNVNVAIASEQDQRLVALIALTTDLAREARQAKDVRGIVSKRGAVVDRALASSSVQVTTWNRGPHAKPTTSTGTPCSGPTSAIARACRPTSGSSSLPACSLLARLRRMDRYALLWSQMQSTWLPKLRRDWAMRPPAASRRRSAAARLNIDASPARSA